jgi:flagellar biosynthesis/type III secretory pathway protein FliH
MSNDNLAPAFTEIVDGFMNMRAYAPAPAPTPADTATYQMPVTTAELAQLMGSVYRDAHALGYSEGYAAGDLQGKEDAEQARSVSQEQTLKDYAGLWSAGYKAAEDLACVIRQFDDMTPSQITSTLRGVVSILNAQLNKGDK